MCHTELAETFMYERDVFCTTAWHYYYFSFYYKLEKLSNILLDWDCLCLTNGTVHVV